MSALNPFTSARDLWRMVTMPLKALFLVGLCAIINAMTSPGHWWVKWVALGMGIAVLVSFARGIKALLVLGAAWWIGRWLHRQYGDQARAAFADWVMRERPNVPAMIQRLRVVGQP